MAARLSGQKIYTLADLPALEAQRQSSTQTHSNLQNRIVTLDQLPRETRDDKKALDQLLSQTRGMSAEVERMSASLDALEQRLRIPLNRSGQNIHTPANQNGEVLDFNHQHAESNFALTQSYTDLQRQLDQLSLQQKEILEQRERQHSNTRCVVISALAVATFILTGLRFFR